MIKLLHKVKRTTKRFVPIMLSSIMTISMCQMNTFAAEADGDDQKDINERIEALLSAGNYQEGEAVALVADKNVVDEIISNKDVLKDAEEISVIDTETYEEFAENNDDLVSMGEAAESGAVVDDPTIVHISDSGKTTKELLKKLLSDDRVLIAEPNYIETVYENTTFDTKKQDKDVIKNKIKAKCKDKDTSLDIPDLTSFQWAYDNTGKELSTFAEAMPGFDMNPDNWNRYDKKNRPVTNATGVVCIMDSGVDYTNPDLANVMISDMKRYNKNGGNYGFDATTDTIEEPMDIVGHGTHCAGIVAAEWNKMGTSGIANGCKLCAVKNMDSQGNILIANVIRGYEYLCDAVDNGLNLVAVNNSWGGAISGGSLLRLMINKLGEKGANTFFASGNGKTDHDKVIDITSSAVNSPYALIVNSCRSDGQAADESDYGSFTTDIYAPGDAILSTSANCDLRHYPILEKNSIAKELFHQKNPKIIFTKSSTLANSQKEAISQKISAKRDNKLGFEGNDSYRIRLSDMELVKEIRESWYDEDSEEDASYTYYCSAYIPIEKAAFHKGAFFACSLLTDCEERLNCSLSIAIKTGDKADWKAVNLFGDGVARNAWRSLEFSYAEELEDNEEPMIISMNKKYGLLPVRFAITDAHENELPDVSVYFDAIGVVDNPAHYKYASGTSMATPAVAGAAAIIAYRQLQAGDDLFGSDAGSCALKRANILKGSVAHYDGQFEGKCTSGGTLDLSLKEDQYTPVVNSLNWDKEKSQIIIKGDFFGSTESSVEIKGLADTKVASWSNEEIILNTDQTPKTDLYVVTVEAKNGNSSNYRFLLETSNQQKVFEGNIPLPDDKHVLSVGDKVIMGGDGRYLYASFRDVNTGLYSDIFVYDTESDQWVDELVLPDMEKCDYVSIANDAENVYIYCCYHDGYDISSPGIANLYTYNRDVDQGLRKIEIENIPSKSTLVYTQGKLYFATGGYYNKIGDEEPEVEEDEMEGGEPEIEVEELKLEGEEPEIEEDEVEEEDSSVIYLYEEANKIWQIIPEESNQNKAVIEEVGDLEYYASNPPVIAATEDGFYMMWKDIEEYFLQKVVIDDNEITVSDQNSLLPEIATDYSRERDVAITGVNGGIIISGIYLLEGTDGIMDTDTYFLENGGSSLVPMEKRADTDLIMNAYAYTMNNRLYVCGAGMNMSSGLFIHYTEMN